MKYGKKLIEIDKKFKKILKKNFEIKTKHFEKIKNKTKYGYKEETVFFEIKCKTFKNNPLKFGIDCPYEYTSFDNFEKQTLMASKKMKSISKKTLKNLNGYFLSIILRLKLMNISAISIIDDPYIFIQGELLDECSSIEGSIDYLLYYPRIFYL